MSVHFYTLSFLHKLVNLENTESYRVCLYFKVLKACQHHVSVYYIAFISNSSWKFSHHLVFSLHTLRAYNNKSKYAQWRKEAERFIESHLQYQIKTSEFQS